MTQQPCLEFFNDVRVLNTAMTRAQSQVIVVGDATALCCSYFGKCWRLWKSYIHYCIDARSVYPEEFTLDSLSQELLEISNTIKPEDDDNSDTESTISELPDNTEDPILKELLDEDKDLQIKLTDEGLFPVLCSKNFENNTNCVMQRRPSGHKPIVLSQFNQKICELVMERFDHGVARPLDDPSLKINIKGRKNLGQSFSGDIVRVEIINSETIPPKGKVIEVIEPADLPGEFVCTIDSNDTQLMTPINMCIPKLFTPFSKNKPGYIAIRDPGTWAVKRFVKITMETRRNYLFVVKMLRWKKGFYYPLGIAVNILPRVTSFEQGLKVLETEYTLNRIIPLPVQREVEKIIENTPLFTKDYQDFTKLMTFTIDCSKSKDLDDAISVRDLGQRYEIGIHIADVASFVNKDSELDKYAQQQGTTFYVSKAEPAHMFPSKLSTDFLSLSPGSNRRCISLITEVDKQTDCVRRTKFVKSVIQSKRKLSYEEAEKILKTSGDGGYSFDTLEGCLAVACHFAEVHQKARKQDDWCYSSPDEDVVIGERRSRKLVEELMIMFNHTVADMLLSKSKTLKKTPLRCQTRPESDQLKDFRERNIAWLPLSIHLSARCNIHTESQQTGERFAVLTSILRQLKIAAKDNDINMIVDLVTTDEIYPQLLPLAIGLRRLLGKALILRSNSSYLSRTGHFDLQLDSYTWATSPIRRYVDVIVQRLLHSVLDNTEIQYSHNEIDRCCVEFTQKNRKQNECEKKSHALRLAFQLSNQNELHVAYIVQITPNGKDFMLLFPLNTDSINEMIRLKYRDLQLADQPAYDEVKNHMVLKWVRRMYFFSSSNMNELHPQDAASVTTYVPNESWKCLLAAIRTQNRDVMFQVIQQMNSFIHPKQPLRKKTQRLATASEIKPSVLKEDHFTEMTLKLKKGENIEVQLGNDTNRGLLVPSVQLLIVNPEFEICVEHTKDPILCFSKYVLHPSRTSYYTYRDYQQIWKPLCEMESACSAVAENESIIIKNAPLIWKTVQDKALQGTFNLPLEKRTQWAIDGNLRNCFLCIRLRIQKKELAKSLNDSTPDPHNFTRAPGLIWVAHGVVTNVSGEVESKELNYLSINFRINHKPMTNVPGCIFSKDARFTIELIPKILPDVRKENAVENLTTANILVKAIATGKKTTDLRTNIQKRGPVRFEIKDHQFFGLSQLNTSQSHAIREALNNQFTLIQGPPGTGKTVVGVHIVYWFFKENDMKPAHESEKKRCILYCGPSNKSVDVVAGQLLKLQKTLKPLRVYSEQMEILEFPYPGSNLRLSRHSQRVEKPKSELRSITLHHRIRMAHNQFSSQILAFDLKIKQQESLTDEEIKSYKDCLRRARKYELQQHDVILCTCTAASHPLLAKVLSFEQIIIDECAMATEPEAFIPLVTHTPTQIVLIGDHKQLQPVVNCELLQKLGMTKSLFERYMKKALMLDTQYRMQEDICAFPSQEFYEGKLKTGTKRKPSLFLSSSQSPTPIIFGHVEGEEISLVVSTEKGNENSKANIAEAEQAVRIATHLIKTGIESKDIAILTPYNAQVSKVNEILLQYKIKNLTVSTIMKSQGSEWRCVILTTVRSCPKMDIETDPTKGWLLKYLGFVMVPHQVNVGITRAQEGLCILGNKDLLWCSSLWRRLLKHYQNKGCLVNPADSIQISVARG